MLLVSRGKKAVWLVHERTGWAEWWGWSGWGAVVNIRRGKPGWRVLWGVEPRLGRGKPGWWTSKMTIAFWGNTRQRPLVMIIVTLCRDISTILPALTPLRLPSIPLFSLRRWKAFLKKVVSNFPILVLTHIHITPRMPRPASPTHPPILVPLPSRRSSQTDQVGRHHTHSIILPAVSCLAGLVCCLSESGQGDILHLRLVINP